MSRLLFLHLPVADLAASREFFAQLGFEFGGRLRDDGAVCMVLSEQAYVILLTRERFAELVPRPVPGAGAATGLALAVSAGDRAAVDALAATALAAGATPGKDPQDYGFMYGRSFHDLDGYLWEVMWMDPVVAADGPGEYMAEDA